MKDNYSSTKVLVNLVKKKYHFFVQKGSRLSVWHVKSLEVDTLVLTRK